MFLRKNDNEKECLTMEGYLVSAVKSWKRSPTLAPSSASITSMAASVGQPGTASHSFCSSNRKLKQRTAVSFCSQIISYMTALVGQPGTALYSFCSSNRKLKYITALQLLYSSTINSTYGRLGGVCGHCVAQLLQLEQEAEIENSGSTSVARLLVLAGRASHSFCRIAWLAAGALQTWVGNIGQLQVSAGLPQAKH